MVFFSKVWIYKEHLSYTLTSLLNDRRDRFSSLMQWTQQKYTSSLSVDLLTWGWVLGPGQLKKKKTKSVFADTMCVVTVHSVHEEEMYFDVSLLCLSHTERKTCTNAPKRFLPFSTSNLIGCQWYPSFDNWPTAGPTVSWGNNRCFCFGLSTGS